MRIPHVILKLTGDGMEEIGLSVLGPSAGITQIRFYGYNLRLLDGTTPW